MKTIRFSIHISKQELMRYYRGSVKNIHLEDAAGSSLQFPVNLIQKFVTHSGVHGEFEMRVDDNNKFIDIRRLPW